MRVLMYHYVRSSRADWPYFHHLDFDNFRRQLDWLAEQGRFPTADEVFSARQTGVVPEGFVLTFDDGLRDHYDFVFPELKRRGLWGIFYVPTGMYQTNKLLDVHRIHLLLGRHGGQKALAFLEALLTPDMLVDAHMREFGDQTYLRQKNDNATALFKRILNYFISYDYRQEILDHMMQSLGDEAILARDFYLSESHMREMNEAGMVIGSHGKNHLVFSKLSEAEQEQEISDSLAFLNNAIGSSVRTFCYPYGGPLTFSAETERILARYGITMSFAVDPRDVTDEDILNRPHALPRWDCNMFPHGQSAISQDCS